MVVLAEVCAGLGDQGSAAVLQERLTPCSGIMADNGLSTFGAIDRYLGLLSATRGMLDDADRYFAAAAALHEGVGAPIWLARTRLDWARALRRRGQPGDEQRAAELLSQAFASARTRGWETIAKWAEQEMWGTDGRR